MFVLCPEGGTKGWVRDQLPEGLTRTIGHVPAKAATAPILLMSPYRGGSVARGLIILCGITPGDSGDFHP